MGHLNILNIFLIFSNFGRQSFYGMNPDIETLMKIHKERELADKITKNEKDVQDIEMAHFYSTKGNSCIGTISNKFSSKRGYVNQQGNFPYRQNLNMTNKEAIENGQQIIDKARTFVGKLANFKKSARK